MLEVGLLEQRYLPQRDIDYSSSFVFTAPYIGTIRSDAPFAIDYNPEANLQAARDAVLKRLFDVCFAAVFLIVALPVLIVLSIALQIDSPGRLFFVQPRVGRHNRMFNCFKFRTMHEDAEALLAGLLAQSDEARREWDADHKLREDPRVSRLGRIVRKLSLDELPQLLNILAGEMSVVGPRPIVRAEVSKYGTHFPDYCAVKPGLTGLWQVSGRNDVSYDERVQLDCKYRQNASFAFDMSIVLRTIPAVLGAKGSY
jgi:exopolysaccharide production protein ExoY